ncbi:MAG: SUMF1/EgtB/PvdO family nonheme iron enzyme [Acidobacteria bacterium]|jgi:formylglycine-generating enzyme required for sulfatase activity|nr:SUMF1/EgtB/PvdO family nonheme iron enzyme [Acidobacteriota bacterium]
MKKLFILGILISLTIPTLLAQEKGTLDSVTPYSNQSISIDFEHQWAFIIAIDRYVYLNPLKYPVKEAGQVANLLENRYGYSSSRVKTLPDDKATYGAVMAQLRWYVQNLAEKDNLFIYFSGHGYKDDVLKKGFWMPCDACSDTQAARDEKEKATETLVKISNHDIVDVLRECKARHIFVVADSCFSGQFFAAQPKVGRVPGTHYNLKSRQLLASGRELVGDGDFGKYFVRCLEANQEPYLLASDIITNVRTMVMNNTNLEPEGKTVKNTDDEGGEFILVRRLASLKALEYKPNRPVNPADIDVDGLKAEAEGKRLQREKEKTAWQSWQSDFQKQVENLQKSDKEKTVSSTSKRKAWENILSKYNKDNPDTREDEELRKFVNGRIEYWAAKEKEELEWSTWQRKFNENVEKLKVIDKDPDISSASKKQKWQELLINYSMDNPYSYEDEQLRTYAAERIKDLESGSNSDRKVILSETKKSKSKESNPFSTNINNKAKNIYKNSSGFWEADYGDGIIMIYVPPGEFTMGSNDIDDEKPPHTVSLDGYWVGKYEVTFAQYDRYCEETPKEKPYDVGWGRGDRPVINVSWEDAAAYCLWLSQKTGLKFQLPTEAQWEKAARGTDGLQYPWGNDFDKNKCNSFENGVKKTMPVGSYPSGTSPSGCMDMAGNVWEWCADWYDKDYYKNSPARNPQGPSAGSTHVVRGGSCFSWGWVCRATHRFPNSGSFCSKIGFRLCQENQ